MRRPVAGSLLLLASCAAAPAPIPVHGETPGHTCKTAATERFIGLPATRETGAVILKATGSSVLRWVPIGYMLTMDYRADRVTVRLGTDRKVTAISCG